MPSLEVKLAEHMVRVKGLTEGLEKEIEERRRDHDKITRLEEGMKTMIDFIKTVEEERKEKRNRGWQVVFALIAAVISLVVTAIQFKSSIGK